MLEYLDSCLAGSILPWLLCSGAASWWCDGCCCSLLALGVGRRVLTIVTPKHESAFAIAIRNPLQSHLTFTEAGEPRALLYTLLPFQSTSLERRQSGPCVPTVAPNLCSLHIPKVQQSWMLGFGAW